MTALFLFPGRWIVILVSHEERSIFEGMCQKVFIHNQKKWKGIGKKLWVRN